MRHISQHLEARVTALLRWRASRTTDTRRVVTHADAQALVDFVRAAKGKNGANIVIDHRVSRITKVSSRVPGVSVDADQLTISWGSNVGSVVGLGIYTNVRDARTLQRLIHQVDANATPPVDESSSYSLPPDPAANITLMPVSLWRTGTEQAWGPLHEELLARCVAAMRQSSLWCTGTLAVIQRAQLFGGSGTWGEDTDSELSVTARTEDGTASGWSGQAHRDATQLAPERIVHDAVDMALRNRGARRAEPGRYTAILSPTAVGQLVAAMCRSFDMGFFVGPLRYHPSVNGRTIRFGERVLDRRITLSTDPADPEGGDFPYYPDDGFPTRGETWVDQGVLKKMGSNLAWALGLGFYPPVKGPASMRMSGGTTSIAEMIAQCERGIYVHRLGGMAPRNEQACMFYGVTRHGCWLVKDGKIDRPVTNFRFYDSPFLRFNQVKALGVPQRVAFGYPPPPSDFQLGPRVGDVDWPHPPIIVPPMMVGDFNFCSLVDAV